MNKDAPRVLFSGDVFGRLNALSKRVASVNKSNGPFDALFCVGQFLPTAVQGIEEFQEYVEGRKVVPIPTYFLGDYGEGAAILLSAARAEAANAGLTSDGIRVCENLFWLRGSGILNFKGLKIAFLGGKYDASLYHDAKAAAVAGAHHEDDVDALRACADDPTVVDVFLTNEWPSGILAGADLSAVPAELSQPTGTSVVAELAAELKPRYHIVGSCGVFYAREPYTSDGSIHVTRFIGLGAVGNDKKQKFLHALSPTPASAMTPAELGVKVANTTPSPYEVAGNSAALNAGKVSAKNKAESAPGREDGLEGQYWRYADNKRQKTRDGTGGARVCFEFVSKGSCSREPRCHFKHDIDGVPIQRGSCFDFITKGSCEKGADCRYRHSLEPGSGGKVLKAPAEPCWFCLSNPDVDKHLVISVGDHCYCALAKGPLVPGHVLIIPIEHVPSLTSLSSDAQDDIDKYKEALRQCFNGQGQAVVFFERYLQLRAGTHAHLQVLPIPLAKAGKVQGAFESAGADVGLEFRVFPPTGDADERKQALKYCLGDGVNYFTVELPDGTVLAQPLVSGVKMPMQFGREVLANLLDVPERGDWKACKISKEEESNTVQEFGRIFRQFDPDKD